MTIGVFVIMCIVMYCCKMFPWQNPNWTPKNPVPMEPRPAKMTSDIDIHRRIAEGTYRHQEL